MKMDADARIAATRAMLEVDKAYEWHRWMREMPFLSFPRGWKIQIIPPFFGAIVRFVVSKGDPKKYVSVYFDAYEQLGIMETPYWEIYPSKDGEPMRFFLGKEDEMIKEIGLSLKKMGR